MALPKIAVRVPRRAQRAEEREKILFVPVGQTVEIVPGVLGLAAVEEDRLRQCGGATVVDVGRSVRDPPETGGREKGVYPNLAKPSGSISEGSVSR